jgi:hypothetical protein
MADAAGGSGESLGSLAGPGADGRKAEREKGIHGAVGRRIKQFQVSTAGRFLGKQLPVAKNNSCPTIPLTCIVSCNH